MTIENSAKNKKGIKFLIKIFTLILVGGLLHVYLYSLIVDKRHAIKDMRDTIVMLEADNVDLKNELYTIIDPPELERLADEGPYVFERNPKYLNISQWMSDSSY